MGHTRFDTLSEMKNDRSSGFRSPSPCAAVVLRCESVCTSLQAPVSAPRKHCNSHSHTLAGSPGPQADSVPAAIRFCCARRHGTAYSCMSDQRLVDLAGCRSRSGHSVMSLRAAGMLLLSCGAEPAACARRPLPLLPQSTWLLRAACLLPPPAREMSSSCESTSAADPAKLPPNADGASGDDNTSDGDTVAAASADGALWQRRSEPLRAWDRPDDRNRLLIFYSDHYEVVSWFPASRMASACQCMPAVSLCIWHMRSGTAPEMLRVEGGSKLDVTWRVHFVLGAAGRAPLPYGQVRTSSLAAER